MSVFELLVWGGAALTVAGLLLLLWCILRVFRARSANLDDEALRAVLARLVPVNLGALLLSAFGLMLVIVGLVMS